MMPVIIGSVVLVLMSRLVCLFFRELRLVRLRELYLNQLAKEFACLRNSIAHGNDTRARREEIALLLREIVTIKEAHSNNPVVMAIDLIARTCRLFAFPKRGGAAVPEDLEQPPKLAEYLLYFLPKAQRESLMGDMEEIYSVLLKVQGRHRARFWYWCQVLMAYQPLWSNKIARRVAKWAAITGLGQLLGRVIPWEWVRRVLPLGEWIRRIVS